MADRAEPELPQGQAECLMASTPPDTQSRSNPEVSAPMLDVHAPHQAIHTWNEFLVHIAAITIGLLIAVGLEQTVEFIHHQHQLADIRKSLQLELSLNVDRFTAETELSRRYVPTLRTNLAVYQYLQLHPGAAPAQWPGVLSWTSFDPFYWTNAWETAKQSGVLAYMPEAELRHYAAIYRRLQGLDDSVRARRSAVSRATGYSIAQPNASLLSPAQIDQQVALTASVLEAYRETALLQRALAAQIHEFSSAPTEADLEAITHQPANAEALKAVYAIVNKFLAKERDLSDSEVPK